MITHGSCVPVTVLTGFLGAGKTTWLNAWIRGHADRGWGVLENEAGAVGIDGAVIRRSVERLIEIDDGCLCCVVRDDVAAAVDQLCRSDGVEHIVIELSGLADPGPVVDTLNHHPMIAGRVELAGIVVVVDAINLRDDLVRHPEVRRQLAYADLAVVAKSDLCSAELDDVVSAIRGVSPVARVIGSRDSADLDMFGPSAGRRADESESTLQHSDLSAVTIRLDREVDGELFYRWLGDLVGLRGRDLVRIKANVAVRGFSRPLRVQGVHDRVRTDWGEEALTDTSSTLIFIGRSLNADRIEAGLLACTAGGPGGTDSILEAMGAA
ncbi:GTP-binding protein [Rhodococcus sp. WS4]|nr:GTP-binding protein [Rhodococcus sp. WS4]